MRFLYTLRVLLISVEAIILLVAVLCWRYVSGDLQSFASSVQFNEKLVGYLMLVPIGLSGWIVNETRLTLTEHKEDSSVLVSWPEYWRLKVHAWVGLSYAAIFGIISLLPWMTISGIASGAGLLLFLTSTLGNLVVARDAFAARVRMHELLAGSKDS